MHLHMVHAVITRVCVGAVHESKALFSNASCYIETSAKKMISMIITTSKTNDLETVDTQNWHDEGFLDNPGRTGQTSPLNRSDRSIQVCQIANWTAPLRRSRRDDRNAYIERIIRSPDEGVTPPRRPAPRSDRSREVRPV